jgi:hypothetical protein
VYQPTLSLATSEPALVPELSRLFRTAFGPDIPPEFLDPAFLYWKFFERRPGWQGPRSYVIQHDEGVAAHACLWPVAFHTPSGIVRSCHLLDWAANPAAPGAGIAIYRELAEKSGTAIAIGGSKQARRLLPKLGFEPYGVLRYFARVIRPLAQFRARPKSSLSREALRLARNAVWALTPRKRAVPDWSATHVEYASDWLDELVRDPGCAFCSPGVRSSALVNYLLDCPAARCRLYAVGAEARPFGYFLLNEVHGQTRIIDLFVRSTEPAAWEAACRLALESAAELPGTSEVVAASSLAWLDGVFRGCGMREREARPVMLYDPRGRLESASPLHLQMVDSDAFFLYSPAFPFLT